MKRILLYLLLFVSAICGAVAQNDAMRIRLKNGDIYTFLKTNVDSIGYSKTGSDGIVNANYVVQEIATPDTVYRMPLEEIESVDFFTLYSEENNPVAVDLGLPSGTKWCSCNVGASSPEDYGGYYAWGETSEKSMYDWENYAYYDSATGGCINIGSDIAGTQYDVAHVQMGAPWHMPTKEQIQELFDHCIWQWAKLNGVNGQLVTGPNGGQIFLPSADRRYNDGLIVDGVYGNYWSSSLDSNHDNYAFFLDFYSGHWSLYITYRYCGQSVRPVCQ